MFRHYKIKKTFKKIKKFQKQKDSNTRFYKNNKRRKNCFFISLTTTTTTVILYSASSRLSTQECSQPSPGQTERS